MCISVVTWKRTNYNQSWINLLERAYFTLVEELYMKQTLMISGTGMNNLHLNRLVQKEWITKTHPTD